MLTNSYNHVLAFVDSSPRSTARVVTDSIAGFKFGHDP